MRINTNLNELNKNNNLSKAMFIFEYKKSYYHQGLRKLSNNIDSLAEEAWKIYETNQAVKTTKNKTREREH